MEPVAAANGDAAQPAIVQASSGVGAPMGEQSESLIDIDIPIPGVPYARQGAANAPQAEVANAVPPTSDQGDSRAPEIVPRGRRMRITVESDQLPAVQQIGDTSPGPGLAANASASGVDLPEIITGLADLQDSAGVVSHAQALTLQDDPSGQLIISQSMEAAEQYDYQEQLAPPEIATLEYPELAQADQPEASQQSPATDESPMFVEMPVADETESPPEQPPGHAKGPSVPAREIALDTSTAVATGPRNLGSLHRISDSLDQPSAKNETFRGEMTVGPTVVVRREDSAIIEKQKRVIEYSVEHPGICNLIQTGNNALSLIGLKEGDTRIAVVTAGDEGKRNIEIHSVRVASATTAQVELSGLAREVTRTIARLYPRSQIEVLTDGDQLIVQGNVELERDARKIVNLVRKTSLIPVVDRVQAFRR